MTIASLAKRLYLALVKRDEYSRFLIAEWISSLIYPTYKYSEFGRLCLFDTGFIKLYESFEGMNNYHSFDRKYTIRELAKLAIAIDGDTAECGAYRGASSYLICQRTDGYGKIHHIFDSFEGLSSPGSKDGSYWKRGDLRVGEHEIMENLSRFDFVRYYKDWIPNQFYKVNHKRFSFIHIDVDLYQPTYDALRFFYERVNKGGVIVCDDYGFITCPGAKMAVDEFFRDKPEPVISLPTGQAFIIKG